MISTFLQTAANPRYQQSLFHNCLFRYYCLGDWSLDKPTMPPYYNQTFSTVSRKLKTNKSPMNPIHMTLKQWYNFLLEEYITMEEIDDVGRQKPKKCWVELLAPDVDWSKSYYLSRLRGLSTETRSFCFKLLHQLLPLMQDSSTCFQTPVQNVPYAKVDNLTPHSMD